MSDREIARALEILIDSLYANLGGAAFGEVLDRLVWLTHDNGSTVVEVCREWPGSDDRRRVEAALSYREGWLFESRSELNARLSEVGERWPEMSPRIREIIGAHREQFADIGTIRPLGRAAASSSSSASSG
jgi:hypothetical protein